MKVFLRVDLGGIHGMGHMTRMRALAQALQARGATVTFITDSPALAAEVPAWETLCGSLYTELPFLAAADVLVIDSPVLLNEATYASLNAVVPLVRVDHPTALPGSCSFLLAPGAHWADVTVARLREQFGPQFLYGLDYVLLEDAVTQCPRIPYAARMDGPLVLCAGGSDPAGALATMASWLGSVVQRTDWVALVPAYGGPVALPAWVRPEPFSRAWLRRAALLLTTWGVTVYEALWWGVPALMVPTTDATMADASRLIDASSGAMRAVSLVLRERASHGLQVLLQEFFSDSTTHARMSAASAGLLDGQGAARAADAILSLERM